MNKQLRKLIAFSSAAAVFANVTALTAQAAWTAAPIAEQDFDFAAVLPEENVYVRNASADQPAELVVIGKDGKKNTFPLADGISAVSTAARVYGGTSSAYGFSFNDPAFAVALDKHGCMIAELQKDTSVQYAIVDKQTGKLISNIYDDIRILSDDLLIVAKNVQTVDPETNTTITRRIGGLIGADGREIITPDAKYGAFHLTADKQHLIIHTTSGDYISDLKGKPVSENYAEITFIEEGMGRFFTNWHDINEPNFSFGIYESYILSDTLLRFQNSEGKYAVAFSGLKPQTAYYSRVYLCSENTIRQNSFGGRDITTRYHVACRPDPGEGYSADTVYYDLEGNEVTNYDTIWSLTLTDGEQTYDYLYVNKALDAGFESGYFGPATIFDTEKNILLECDQIITWTKEKIVIQKDNTYQILNAKLEVIETYSELGSFADGWYCRKDKTYMQMDKDFNVFSVNIPPEQIERETGYGKVILQNNGVRFGYLVKSKETPLTWEIWDLENVTRNSFTLTPQHGGTLDEKETKLHHYRQNDPEANKKPRLDAELAETVTTEKGNKYYDDTLYYYINSNFEILVTDNPNVDVADTLFISTDKDGKKTILDASGKDITPGAYNDFAAYTEENSKGKTEYYLAGIADSSFTVYDSSLKELYTLSGKPVNENVYEKDGKYGFYLLSAGGRSDASYTPAYEDGFLRYFCTEELTGTKIPLKERMYPMTNGKTLRFFDGYGNLFTTIDTTYLFPGGTQGTYDFTSLIFNDKTADGKGRTYIYDATANEVKYEQTGIYDSILHAGGDYAVTVSGDAHGLIRTDGTVLVAPTKGLNITLSRYSFGGSSGIYSGNSVDIRYNNNEPNDIREIEGVDYYAVFGTFSPSGGFDVPVSLLEPDYAKKYGYDAAVSTDYDCYVVFKNGKWGLADKAGKALCEPTYDWICRFSGGLAWTITFDKNGRWHQGILDKNGTAVVAPDLDNEASLSFQTVCIGDQLYLTDISTAVYSSRIVMQAEDHFNEFAQKYGYQTAVKYGDLYLVMKDGLTGVVTAENKVLIPLEYAQAMYFPADDYSMRNLDDTQKAALSEAPYATPFLAYADGTKLITFKTAEGKIRAYQLKDDSVPVCTLPGDFNGDGELKINDAVLMLRSLAEDADVQPAAGAFMLSDLDGDGELTVMDVCTLLKMLSKA